MFRITPPLSLVLLATPALAQLRITEILPDAVPLVPPHPVIELTNEGAGPLDVGDYTLSVQFSNYRLPSRVIAPGETVRVNWSIIGIDVGGDLFTGNTVPPMRVDQDSIALYDATGPPSPLYFSDPANLRDFVQWGNGWQPRSDVAVGAGLWFGLQNFAPVADPQKGESLAFASGFALFAPAWFRDATPTIGAPNMEPTAKLEFLSTSCPPSAFGIGLGMNSFPAMGNRDFGVSFFGVLPGQATVLLIGSGPAQIPLVNGCFLHMSQVHAAIFRVTGPNGQWNLPLFFPDDPSIPGVELVLEAFGSSQAFGLQGTESFTVSF